MAQSAMDMLGVSKEILDEVKPEEVYEGKTIPAALYDAEIKQAYVRKTDKGANMLEVDFILPPAGPGQEPALYHYSNCVKSGDEKGNKTTYTTKQGNEVPLPGVVALIKFLGAIDELTASAVQGDVVHKGDKISALCFTGLQGKKLKIGVIQEENLFNGNVTLKNDVKYWLDENGDNTVGDNLTEKVKESIEKYPLKKLRASKQTSAPTTGTTQGSEVAAGSGWS